MIWPSRNILLIWLAGIATAGVCAGAGALVVVEGGLFDATASDPHSPIVAWATHTAMVRSVQLRAASIAAPSRFTQAQIEAGLRDYDWACSSCHGAPGVARAAFADGMTPSPPYILDAPRHWRARELYWIVGQGVKMTAMPAWAPSRTEAQLWNLVAFLEAAPDLSPRDYARIRGAAAQNISPAPAK